MRSLSAVFDATRRTLAVVDRFSGQRTMVAQIPVGGRPTIYARVGDLFAWSSVGALALLATIALLSRL